MEPFCKSKYVPTSKDILADNGRNAGLPAINLVLQGSWLHMSTNYPGHFVNNLQSRAALVESYLEAFPPQESRTIKSTSANTV